MLYQKYIPSLLFFGLLAGVPSCLLPQSHMIPSIQASILLRGCRQSPISKSLFQLSSTKLLRARTMASSMIAYIYYVSSWNWRCASFAGDLNIENTNIKTADGVSLDESQKTLVGSVLDASTLASPVLRQIHLLTLRPALCRPPFAQKASTLGRQWRLRRSDHQSGGTTAIRTTMVRSPSSFFGNRTLASRSHLRW